MSNSTVAITQYQGIDLARMKTFMTRLAKNEDFASSTEEESVIAGDVLELIDHVESDGLLDRVAEARKHMAEQDAENILASLP